MITIILPLVAWAAWLIGRFYRRIERNLRVAEEARFDLRPAGPSRAPVVVPIEDINLPAVMALGAACERSRDVRAVHVVMDVDEPSTVARRWRHQFPNIPLVLIDSPFRTVADPIASYVEGLAHQPPYEVEVVVPQVDVRHRHERPLVNQNLKRLQRLLAGHRHIRVTAYRFAEGGPGRRRKRVA